MGPRGFKVLQPRQMAYPRLTVARHHVRVPKLKPDVFKVTGEGCARQPFHILKRECFGPKSPNRAHRLREHIAGVLEGAVLPPKRKGLAGWATRHEVNRSLHLGKVKAANVALDHVPVGEGGKAALLVLADRVAGPLVPVDNHGRLKPCPACRNAEAASTHEKLYRPHQAQRVLPHQI